MNIWRRVCQLAGLSVAGVCMASPAARTAGKTAKDMAAEVQKGEALLIDVREASELVADGMAEPAVWLATSEIKAQSERYQQVLKALPKDKPIYVYCASGRRSGSFAESLQGEGFKASNFGTVAAWKAEKGPMRALAEAKSQPCPYLCGPLK